MAEKSGPNIGPPEEDEARCPNCGLDFYCYRLDTANQEAERFREALEEIYRRDDATVPSVIAARALRRGAWAEQEADNA